MHGVYPHSVGDSIFFGIKYIRYETSVEDVKKAIQEEMEGPGQYLGYRAMQRKVQEHFLVITMGGSFGGRIGSKAWFSNRGQDRPTSSQDQNYHTLTERNFGTSEPLFALC